MKMYEVVTAHNLTALEEQVNDLINRGFVPSGSIAVIGGEEWTQYTQPMIHITLTMTWELREGRVG